MSASNLPYNFNYGLDSSQKRYSYAAFAQTKYKLNDSVSATLGLRFNHDDFNSVNVTNFNLYGGPVSASTHENALTGKGEIDYAVAPHNMLYASVSRGYKPGGVSNNSTPLLVPLTYKPEHVWAYEIGSKNKFADGKITLNAAAFYYNYANMQYQEEDPVPYQGGVSNIPKTHIWGAEAEASFQATHRLSFDGNVTYLGGKLVGNYITLDPSLAHQATLAAAKLGYGPFDYYTIALRAQQVANTNGNTPPKLPEWQGTVGATYVLDVAGGELRTHAEVIYRGKFQYRVFNNGPLDIVPHYTQVNANMSYKPNNSRWTLSVTATNLFNVAGIASRYSNPFGSFTTSDMYIPPRQVIGSVKYAF